MPSPTQTVRIAQLSDTHFLEPGETIEGGFGYDTAEAFDAVCDHLDQHEPHDMIVVTGDVADHGRAAQYRTAAHALGRLKAPVNVVPGNHDQDGAFTAGMGRPSVGTSRVVQAGDWCFLFVDSNAGAMVPHQSGRYVDPLDYGDRLHRNGALGEREASWVRHMCDSTDADHVFIWVHHPPAPPDALSADEAYAQEWQTLMNHLPKVRGFGGGHTHVPKQYTFADRPVFVSPALKNNFDLEAKTLLPPGYRTYEFSSTGDVSSEVHLVDDPRWPRHPLGRAVIALFNGELTFAQLDDIIARKRSAALHQ